MESFVFCKIKQKFMDKHLIDLNLNDQHIDLVVDDCFLTRSTESSTKGLLKVFVISKLKTKSLIELPHCNNSKRLWISSDLLGAKNGKS